jgi:hypothetical protein
MLPKFFITISHCAWRHFISLSNGDKETKQRKRLPTICFKCPQRADHCFWFPRRTVLAKPPTLETLLLANPYIPTLRHQCSRARSMARAPVRPHTYLRGTVDLPGRSDIEGGCSRLTLGVPPFFRSAGAKGIAGIAGHISLHSHASPPGSRASFIGLRTSSASHIFAGKVDIPGRSDHKGGPSCVALGAGRSTFF